MHRLISAALLITLVQAVQASTLVYNVNGYSVNNGERSTFTALEYDNGVITRIYSDPAAAAESDAQTRIDAGGATMLPGLIDAHGHVSSLGVAKRSIDLTGTRSEAEAAQRVAQFLDDGRDGGAQWLLGRGWNQVLWPSNAFPHAKTLDAIVSDRPLALTRIDGHALWVNSAALLAAGIDADTQDPEGGQIIRDADGEPTGVLIDNAMDLVYDARGEPTLAQTAADIVRGLEAAAATGMTAVHDAGISATEMRAYQQLQAAGELPIRVYPMLSVLDPRNDEFLQGGPWRSDDGMVNMRSVKISADGALGSRGAALHRDYSDQPGHKGLLLLSDQDLRHHIRRSAEAGFQVNVHAIGDKANTRVLDELMAINTDPDIRALRHRIEHAQILRPDDIARFHELAVIASIQPTHATSDKNMAGDRLGEARLAGAYAWQTLLTSKARLAGGSDFPVEPPEPLYGLHAAVTRTDREGQPLGGWRAQEKLTREASLSLFTEWAAYAAHEENYLGRLAPGYAADFVLLSEDYFEQPEQAIWQNTVLATVVGGRLVFAADRSPFNPAAP